MLLGRDITLKGYEEHALSVLAERGVVARIMATPHFRTAVRATGCVMAMAHRCPLLSGHHHHYFSRKRGSLYVLYFH
jgi:hypothetical protein